MKEMWWLVFYFFLHLQVTCSSSFNSSSSPSAKHCSPEESSALFLFKSTITTDSTASISCNVLGESYPRTDSWKNNSDCCSWDGVTCDKLTGHVIGLDLSSSCLLGTIHANCSLFRLRHLRRLNLACNYFSPSKIPSNFSQLTKLTHLTLSSSSFSGKVPPEISHLSKLVSLDLSYNHDLHLDQHIFNKLSQNLTDLRVLALDSVNMSSVVPGSLMNLSSSLISLALRDSGLQGKFPTAFFHFLSLQHLTLSGNSGLTGHLPKSNWSSPLKLFDLSSTNFSGKLPNTIGNLIHLNKLDLGACNSFEGPIPTSLGNLTALTYLELSSNAFTGQFPASTSQLSQLTYLYLHDNNFFGVFPDVFLNLSKVVAVSLSTNNFSGQLPLSAFNLTQLSVLDFSRNFFRGQLPNQVSGLLYLTKVSLSATLLNGRIPSWLFSLPSLQLLDLRYNKLTGPIDPVQRPGLLEFVYLGYNEIHGPIPNFIFELVSLTELDLSSNNLSGVLKSEVFSKLQSIESIDLSHNSRLSLANNNVNFTLPVLVTFGFSSCNLTEFPIFLSNSKYLGFLDLSNNRISGGISKWELILWQDLYYLNLSHNLLTSFEQILFPSLNVLDLHSNLLKGPFKLQAPQVQLVLFSNNKLTGEIPSSLCHSSYLDIVDLSNNNFSGKVPECLAEGEYNILTTLNLNGNQLEGSLPPSLVNCSYLEVLDVGNNMINDTFPHGLADLPNLQVLILRSNRFYGPIDDSKTRFPFPKLQILDISHNGFIGFLPTKFFKNFGAMMHGDNNNVKALYLGGYYQISLDLTVKGIDVKMDRVLTIFTTIDLSSNQFDGQIPEVIRNLNSLIVLNFSHNNLTGYIPSSLENLTQLESLDLSSNKLVGKIPIQLKSLTFLSVLNLSYNQLVGPIPQGNQFGTFENNSYIGNSGLCGSPLSKKCSSFGPSEPATTKFHEEHNNSSWFDWEVVTMGYGSGLVIGLSMGYIVFSTRKPQWFVRIVESGQLKIIRSLNGR